MPSGRYLQLRLTLETETLWDFTRLDSLSIEYSPLLAERVVGEVAAASDLQPIGHIAEVPAGQKIELVCDLRAEFAAEQAGFDAVRLTLPSAGALLGLEMGDPPQPVTADSVGRQTRGASDLLAQTHPRRGRTNAALVLGNRHVHGFGHRASRGVHTRWTESAAASRRGRRQRRFGHGSTAHGCHGAGIG